MKVANKKALKNLVRNGALGNGAARQIEEALTDHHAPGKNTVTGKGNPMRAQKRQGDRRKRSPAEIALEPVLVEAFGWWSNGGELVSELHPFTDRRFRADFALPRWRIFIEVDGWQHHGASLKDHHDDRVRAVVFASRDWLPFRVSYKQATEQGEWLVASIRQAMSYRSPSNAGEIEIEQRIMPGGDVWHWLRA